MSNTTIVALSRQNALWREMDTVANNMANANTAGYKTEKVMFAEYMLPTKGDGQQPENLSLVHDVATVHDMADGPLTRTDNPFDFALQGNGFFVVDTPAGERYSRGGQFRRDSQGQLVTGQGFPVLDTNGQPFFFAPTETDIQVGQDGVVSAGDGSGNNIQVGRIRVVDFDNDQALTKVGNGLYSAASQPLDVVQPSVIQGSVEQSNVKPIAEMTRMMEIQRQYQMTQQMINNDGTRLSNMIQTLSKVA